jgi:pimeloyl-ACP methyl ester carboxylesterase
MRRAPVVVMISGAGPYDRYYSAVQGETNQFFEPVEARLRCERVGALRFDEVGTGRSTGDYAAYATTATLADDVTDLVDALRRQPGVDPGRLGLLGHSEGGAIAGIVAARRPSVAAVVLLGAPVHRGDRIMAHQIALEQRDGAEYGRAAREEHAQRSATDRWYRFFLRFSPAPFYAIVRAPMLILQGEHDRAVSPPQADSILRLARGGGNRSVYCRRYPQFDHGFYAGGPGPATAAPALLDDIARFARLVLIDGRPPASPGTSCQRESAGAFTSSASAVRCAAVRRAAARRAAVSRVDSRGCNHRP